MFIHLSLSLFLSRSLFISDDLSAIYHIVSAVQLRARNSVIQVSNVRGTRDKFHGENGERQMNTGTSFGIVPKPRSWQFQFPENRVHRARARARCRRESRNKTWDTSNIMSPFIQFLRLVWLYIWVYITAVNRSNFYEQNYIDRQRTELNRAFELYYYSYRRVRYLVVSLSFTFVYSFPRARALAHERTTAVRLFSFYSFLSLHSSKIKMCARYPKNRIELN